MKQLIGEFSHKIDDKKRLSLPKKLQHNLGEVLILTRGLDNCIFAYTEESWREISEKIAAMPLGQKAARNFSRFLLGSAIEVSLDKSGRVLIPDNLKDFAEISEEVVIVGAGNRLEIWSADKWNEITAEVEEKAEELAETLGEIGMI